MGILFCHLRIIYPACAGVNLAVAKCQKVYFYFPRVRGGQPDFVIDAYATFGFSPHARGSPFRASGSTSQSLHRIRGDQPASKKTRSTLSGFSPHARGSTLPQIAYYVATRIHPACAGINLVLVDFDDLDIYLPRMRGGQPDFVVDAYTTLFFPLHMQGCSFFTTQKCLEEIT